MNEQASSVEQKVVENGQQPAAPELVNPSLSANLRADYEALQNDMEQAQELASDFQRQLSGKSNEFAQLKQVFEKTQKDLVHLQTGIVALRAERHRLANEAMRATAFELKLAKVAAERDHLQLELTAARELIAKNVEEIRRMNVERDAMIGALTNEIASLKRQLEDASRGARVFRENLVKPADEFIEISFGT